MSASASTRNRGQQPVATAGAKPNFIVEIEKIRQAVAANTPHYTEWRRRSSDALSAAALLLADMLDAGYDRDDAALAGLAQRFDPKSRHKTGSPESYMARLICGPGPHKNAPRTVGLAGVALSRHPRDERERVLKESGGVSGLARKYLAEATATTDAVPTRLSPGAEPEAGNAPCPSVAGWSVEAPRGLLEHSALAEPEMAVVRLRPGTRIIEVLACPIDGVAVVEIRHPDGGDKVAADALARVTVLRRQDTAAGTVAVVRATSQLLPLVARGTLRIIAVAKDDGEGSIVDGYGAFENSAS